MAVFGRSFPIKPWIRRQTLSSSSPTTVSPPTANWHWGGNAPTFAFASASTAKSWAWHGQAPGLGFAIAAQQKGWVWNHQAPLLMLAISAAQKAWAWAAGAPLLSQLIAAAQRAWVWAANAPTITGGGAASGPLIVRYMGGIWKRRRSRPPQ